RRKFRGDHLLVGGRRLEQADVLREAVHARDFFRRDARVVIRQIAAHEFRDQLRFRGRKAFLADRGGAVGIFLERAVRAHQRAHRGAGGGGLLFDQFFRRHQRGKSIIARRGRAVAAAERDFTAHAVGPETVELAVLERFGGGQAEGNVGTGGAGNRHDLHVV